ncbi:MAG: glucokinase [Pseudomonadota bacterium]
MTGAQEIVAVDVGGTHARFAIATIDAGGLIALSEPATLKTQDHAGFQAAWDAYREMMGGYLPDAVAIAVAALVNSEVIHFTNNPWTFHPPLIAQELGCKSHVIVNDFEAVAHAVARSSNDHFVHLAGPEIDLPGSGTISVIGPGTGLGVAQFYRDGQGRNGGGYRVHSTEGGHGAFAPLDAVEDAILTRLRNRFPRVSNERVISGPAIVDIYAALAAMEGHAIRDLDDVTIWETGLSGEESLAAAAVDRFCLALGSVAGDIALSHGACGVVITGGLGYRIRDTLLRSDFAARFTAKGRFSDHMATLPVKILTHSQPGLVGAALAYAQSIASAF